MKNPLRALLYAAAGGLTAGILFRFVAGDSVAFSVVVGIAIGAALLYFQWRDRRGSAAELSETPFPAFSAMFGLVGLGILVWGVASGSSSLVLAGLPLVAVAAALVGVTFWQRRPK